MTLNGAPLTAAATTTANNKLEPEAKLELSFEYLVAADKLVWITVVSSQAILMSICLQSMVEELVRIRAGEKEPRRLTRCAAKPRTIQVGVYHCHHVAWKPDKNVVPVIVYLCLEGLQYR